VISRLAFIVALSLSVEFLTACQEEQAKTAASIVRPVKALKLGDPAVFQKRSFPGRAKATNEVELSFRVAGSLIDLPINIGDKLEVGGRVARLDPATFEAEVERLTAEVNKAEATHENARLQLGRREKLLDQGWVTQAAVDRFRANEKEGRARVVASKAVLEKAKLDLGYTRLDAPFAGTVVAKYVENFQDVRAKQRIARLVDPSRIEMIVNIPESLISLVPQVRDITVTFDAFPQKPIPAKVKEIGAEASETTRTYPVTLIMDQHEDVKILPGMAGKATGTPGAGREEAGAAVLVPAAALLVAEDGESSVWVIDEGAMTVDRRQVKIGELTGAGVQVIGGLKAGEWIVIAGIHSLGPGQKVKILEQ